MIKPTAKTNVYALDYHECAKYIESLLGYKLRGVKGKFTREGGGLYENTKVPYLDFWHWVLEKTDLCNGAPILMHEEWGEDAEDWQLEILNKFLEILNKFLDEFGEGPEGERNVELWVEW